MYVKKNSSTVWKERKRERRKSVAREMGINKEMYDVNMEQVRGSILFCACEGYLV
jgi:hypothetical protein